MKIIEKREYMTGKMRVTLILKGAPRSLKFSSGYKIVSLEIPEGPYRNEARKDFTSAEISALKEKIKMSGIAKKCLTRTVLMEKEIAILN